MKYTDISVEGCEMVSGDSVRYHAHRTMYASQADAVRAMEIFIYDLPDELPEPILFWPPGTTSGEVV